MHWEAQSGYFNDIWEEVHAPDMENFQLSIFAYQQPAIFSQKLLCDLRGR